MLTAYCTYLAFIVLVLYGLHYWQMSPSKFMEGLVDLRWHALDAYGLPLWPLTLHTSWGPILRDHYHASTIPTNLVGFPLLYDDHCPRHTVYYRGEEVRLV